MPSDDDLARRFRRMRVEDAADAPPLPDAAALRARTRSRRAFGTLVTGAAAASLLVVAGLLVTERGPADDPAALYADAMHGVALETDQFLHVSSVVAPGMLTLPRVLDPAQSGNADEVLN